MSDTKTEAVTEPSAFELRIRDAFAQFENIHLRDPSADGWLLKQRVWRLCDEVVRRAEEVERG